MTLAELKTQCLISKGHGSSITTLVIPRKSPPVDDFIRVKGMGKGYVLNAVQRNGRWEICAHFNVDTILRTIAKQEALDATRAEGDSQS